MGEMETDGQRNPARGKEVLLGVDADQRMLVIEQQDEACRRSLRKRIADRGA